MKAGTAAVDLRSGKISQPGKIRIFPLLLAEAIPLLVGGFSAFLTAGDMNLYKVISPPPLAPPSWVFPVAWTVLYLMMGYASYLVYVADADPAKKKQALGFYIAQLFFNLFWSTLFFTYRQFLFAFIWLAVMWVFVLISTIRFYRIRPAAGLMMTPLLLWTTFAGYLNAAFYIMSLPSAA